MFPGTPALFLGTFWLLGKGPIVPGNAKMLPGDSSEAARTVRFEDVARQNTVAHLFQLQLGFLALSHMGFSHRRGVPRATI